MAKGNIFLGFGRGKIGDIVLARVNGQQVTRPRNKSPRNPQTSSQMYQRALFTNAVKFYTRGRRSLFQFAFENKRIVESDYNAFMRENVKRGVVISKAALDNYGYPALGNFIMSKGTLPPSGATLVTRGMQMQKSVSATTTPAVVTIGDISKVFIDGVDYLDGDILTFVTIVVNDNTNVPNVDGEGGETTWNVNQIQLNANSVQPLSDFGLSASAVEPSGGVSLVEVHQTVDTILNKSIAAGAVIHSRNTTNGVRVSTEELTLNTEATTAIEAARERSYVDAVVESWRITQQAPVVSEAVMQGSIAQSIAVGFDKGE